MDTRTLDIVRELASARAQFFQNANLYRQRDRLTRQFMETESTFIEFLTRERRQPITITFPVNIPASFMDAIPVVPSTEQIANELLTYSGPSQQTCSICQDSIALNGVMLRGCHHVYHRDCIQTWFCASVRCPVCRRDIREGLGAQTSSGAIETQPQHTSQWGGEDSQG
jgi:hypothetical protein